MGNANSISYNVITKQGYHIIIKIKNKNKKTKKDLKCIKMLREIWD